jgi:hypothetical protein
VAQFAHLVFFAVSSIISEVFALISHDGVEFATHAQCLYQEDQKKQEVHQGDLKNDCEEYHCTREPEPTHSKYEREDVPYLAHFEN